MRRALPLALLLLGCPLTGTIGRDDPTGGGSGGGTIGGSESTGASATEGEVGGTAEGEGSGIGSDSTSTSTSNAESSSDTTADVPHACVPTPDDDECSTCRKTSCCEPLEVCLAHEVCTCWWDCSVMHMPAECDMACTADGGALYDDLQTCTHGHCDACS